MSWILPNVSVPKQSLKLPSGIDIIIIFEHRDKQAFPKPPGTEKKQIPAPQVFYFFDEHGLIDKIVTIGFNCLKTT